MQLAVRGRLESDVVSCKTIIYRIVDFDVLFYFVSGQDYFNYVVGEQLITDRIQTRLAGLKDEYPIDVNYKKVVLCEPVM